MRHGGRTQHCPVMIKRPTIDVPVANRTTPTAKRHRPITIEAQAFLLSFISAPLLCRLPVQQCPALGRVRRCATINVRAKVQRMSVQYCGAHGHIRLLARRASRHPGGHPGRRRLVVRARGWGWGARAGWAGRGTGMGAASGTRASGLPVDGMLRRGRDGWFWAFGCGMFGSRQPLRRQGGRSCWLDATEKGNHDEAIMRSSHGDGTRPSMRLGLGGTDRDRSWIGHFGTIRAGLARVGSNGG
jgi:hypothetical protein